MDVLRSKNFKFGGNSRASVQVRPSGYYVKWIDEHRIIHMKRFSAKSFGKEVAHNRAVAFAMKIPPSPSPASTNPSIKNLID